MCHFFHTRTIYYRLTGLFFIFNFFILSSFSQRQLAVTIDDLPFVTVQKVSWEQKKAWTIQILEALKKHHAPCTGFVNEGKMYSQGKPVAAHVALLKCWPLYGMDLGNHTRSHMDYNNHSFSEFAADVRSGTSITTSVLKKYGKKIVYFRHPFLRRGNTKDKVDSLQTFLREQGYTEAPVTLDNSDWLFARACDNLVIAGDTIRLKELGTTYVQYMEDKLHYFEGQTDSVFHRDIRHILLLHANMLNALFLDDLLRMYERNGYTFISIMEALQDEAYQTADTYYKGGGISWIHRWAISKGLPRTVFAGEPVTPGWVMQVAEIYSE